MGGRVQKSNPINSHTDLVLKPVEYGVREFDLLASRARESGIAWETRAQMYRALGLSNDEKMGVEAKVVRHLANGKLDCYPDTVREVVRYNLFYLCSTDGGKPVFEDEFRLAHGRAVSIRGLARKMDLDTLSAGRLLRVLGLKLDGRGKGRDMQVRDSPDEGVRTGGGEALPGKRAIGYSVMPGDRDGLADYQKGIVVEAFSLNCRIGEAAKRAGVERHRIEGLWQDLCIQGAAAPNPKYDKLTTQERIGSVLVLHGLLR